MMLKFKHSVTGKIENVQVKEPDPPPPGICESDSPEAREIFQKWETACKTVKEQAIRDAASMGWDLILDFADWE